MAHIRKSTVFFVFLGIGLLLVSFMFIHSVFAVREALPALEEKAQLVKRLSLTDLCIFTEASYTRHLSLADFSTAFQDSPLSLEHFPSGSLVEPPEHLRRNETGGAAE
jgi:hypothetical protein